MAGAAATATVMRHQGYGGGGDVFKISQSDIDALLGTGARDSKRSENKRKLEVVWTHIMQNLRRCFGLWTFTDNLVVNESQYEIEFIIGKVICVTVVSLDKDDVIIEAGILKEQNNPSSFVSKFSRIRKFTAKYNNSIQMNQFDGFQEFMKYNAKKAMLCYSLALMDVRNVLVPNDPDKTFELTFTKGTYPMGTCYKVKVEIPEQETPSFCVISFISSWTWKEKENISTKPTNPKEITTTSEFGAYVDSKGSLQNKTTLTSVLITLDQQLDIALRTTHI